MCRVKDTLHLCERFKCQLRSNIQVRRCPKARERGIHVCPDARWTTPWEVLEPYEKCETCRADFFLWKLRVDEGDDVPRPDSPFPVYEDYGK
jgi:hypothetical protein